MSIVVSAARAKIYWLSNRRNNGRLAKGQGILYLCPKGLGQVTRSKAEGLTPAKTFKQRYSGLKSCMVANWQATLIVVFDKTKGNNFAYDDGMRHLIHQLYIKKQIPFDANYGSIQRSNTNSEALIGFNPKKHSTILVKVFKQYFGLAKSFDTRKAPVWRHGQDSAICEIVRILKEHKKCLLAAYTGFGKGLIAMEAAVQVCTQVFPQGAIIHITTPVGNTKKSFKDVTNNLHLGNDRTRKITTLDSKEYTKLGIDALRTRADNGELIFILDTVQAIRHQDDTTTDDEIRDKYKNLSGKIDLWIRDEFHLQYHAEKTSKRLANLDAEYLLDLTATPYEILGEYTPEQIVCRGLPWGLKNRRYTKIPQIRIELFNTLLAQVCPKIAEIYSEEEGWNGRKAFVRDNGNFRHESEILTIFDRFYHSNLSKKKNPFSICNDTQLSSQAKRCGLVVLPAGHNGDSAEKYIPALAKLLTDHAQGKTLFVASTIVEKDCPKNKTIGQYIDQLLQKHRRVIILTCGKFRTGTDIPALGHIILFDKIENIANFEQLLGRMIRRLTGKNEVKLYGLAPTMEIGIVLGRMATESARLSGGNVEEILDNIPISDYDFDSESYRTIDAADILAKTEEWFKDQVKKRLPTNQLMTILAEIDTSIFDGIDLSGHKSSGAKTKITDDNGSRVKGRKNIGTATGQPRTKSEQSRLKAIVNAFQDVMLESCWIAYSNKNYNYKEILNLTEMSMFSTEVIDAIKSLIEDISSIRDMIIRDLQDKQLAHASLDPTEVYDEIFRNNKYKRKLGLVFMPFGVAKVMVDSIPKRINKKVHRILVINALNGTLALEARKRFPNAEIICVELFPYFIDHLKRLGFETKTLDEILNIMKQFDVVLINPPYQKPTSKARQNNGARGKGVTALWPELTQKALSLVKDGGYFVCIHPRGWRGPQDYKGLWTLLTKDNQMEKLVMCSGEKDQDLFGIGVKVDWYIVQKKKKYKNTIVTDYENVTYDLDLAKFPWLPNYAINEIAKLFGNGTVLYDSSSYHTQHRHQWSLSKDKKFKSPVVHNINQDGIGIRHFDSSPKVAKMHFEVAKVLLNKNEIQYPYNDYKGEYGMTELTFGIPLSHPRGSLSAKKEGDAIVAFLYSAEGKRLIAATKWNVTYHTSYKMFKDLKKNWYK